VSTPREIVKRLKSIETPILLEDLVEEIEKTLANVCREVKYELDIFPDWSEKPISEKILYKIKRQLDNLYCDGRKYIVSAKYREYEVNGTIIVHEFEVDSIEEAV
jgi:hypothetical protein